MNENYLNNMNTEILGREGQPHQQYLFSVLLERLDREYAHCRSVILQTFEMVQDLPASTSDDARQTFRQFEYRLAQLESALGAYPGGYKSANASMGDQRGASRRVFANRRIRWGETVEEIRETIFTQLDRLQEQEQPLTTETIKRYVPGMLRWLYGQQKLFDGIEDLREAYEQRRAQESSAASTDQTAAV